MKKHEVEQMAIDFEKEHGTEAFLKVGLSSITQLLVERGMCTEDELRTSFMREVNRWSK